MSRYVNRKPVVYFEATRDETIGDVNIIYVYLFPFLIKSRL